MIMHLSRGRGRKEDILNLQKILHAGNIYNDAIDGVFGVRTEKAVRFLQRMYGITQDGVVGPITSNALKMYDKFVNTRCISHEDIIDNYIDNNKYFPEFVFKNKIVLHHTASGPNPINVRSWFISNNQHVATAFVVGRDGSIMRLFDEKSWAWHLGVGNDRIDNSSIGIELCNWGFLTYKQSKFYNYAGGVVPEEDVVELYFRGQKYWERYTDEQIDSTKLLLSLLSSNYGIPRTFAGFHQLDQSLWYESGIFTHTNFLAGKTDCFPQEELLSMLERFCLNL